MSRRRPVYGCMHLDASPVALANSVSVIAGNITSGNVNSTWAIEGTYLVVREANAGGSPEKFDIQFTFTGLTNLPTELVFVGRYEGNVAHNVLLYIWNYTLLQWDRITASTTDFPNSSTDYTLGINIMASASYLSSGESKIRIYHDSNPVASHYMYIDYIALIQETLDLPVAGHHYQITGMTQGPYKNMVMNPSAGTMTIPVNGDYKITNTISFRGLEYSIIELYIFINDIEIMPMWRTKLEAKGDAKSAAFSTTRNLSKGDVLTFRFESYNNNSYISIFSLRFDLERRN